MPWNSKEDLGESPEISQQLTNDEGWTDAMGFPRVRPEIKQILCLKLDHIGDLLVADFSFRLLKKYFPEAKVTLICGEWNVDLAKVLGIADTVIGVSVFHPLGAEQHDEAAALAARNSGVQRLIQVARELPEFDLAIDLRIDDDTRGMLKYFRSKIYVGSGALTKYPFLDISIPRPEPHLNQAPQRFRLMPRDFIEGTGFEIKSFGLGFSSAILKFPLMLEIEGAITPAECGSNTNDNRLIGIGLESISLLSKRGSDETEVLHQFKFQRGSPDCQFLSDGWSSPERWGTWSLGAQAAMSLSCLESSPQDRFSLDFQCRAFTNPQNRRIVMRALDLTSNSTASIHCDFPDSEIRLSLPVTGARSFGFAKSRPVHIRAGIHAIHVETFRVSTSLPAALRLTVVGTNPEREIATFEMATAHDEHSRGSFEFAFSHRDSDEPLQIRLDAGSSGNPFGLYLVSISSSVVQGAPAKVPGGHMEKLIARVVMAAALECSPIFSETYLLAEERFAASAKLAPSSESSSLVPYLREIAERKRDFKVVGVGIGATKETKRWPFGYILELCELLLRRPDVHLVFVGGNAEVEDTGVLERALGRPARISNICGKTSLAEFGAVLAPMDLFIGYDTGTTHYAGKVGVRTIGIFAAVHSPREWGPVGRRASWITHYTDCSPCYLAKLSECRYGHACMLELLPSECWKTISRVLDGDSYVVGDPSGVSKSVVGLEASPVPRPSSSEDGFGHVAIQLSSEGSTAPTMYHVGRTYRANIDREFSPAFNEGWFHLEAGGIWCGSEGRMRFAYRSSEGADVLVAINCRINSGRDPKLVHVSTGDVQQILSFRSEAWESHTVEVPAKTVDGISTIEITIKCPDAVTPASIGRGADDHRVLGLMICSFTLVPHHFVDQSEVSPD